MAVLDKEEEMLAQLDQIMRLLRRRPAGKQHLGRGAYRLLATVAEKENISTRELADTLGVRPSSLNERLARLEANRVLLRERDPQDQRVFLVRLLPEGEALLQEVREERNRILASIETILSEEELHIMTALAKKLATGLAGSVKEPENVSCR